MDIHSFMYHWTEGDMRMSVYVNQTLQNDNVAEWLNRKCLQT